MDKTTWTEFSQEFIKNYPDLYDRVLIRVKANVTLDFEAHSDLTEDDLKKMLREKISEGQDFDCVFSFENPYKE